MDDISPHQVKETMHFHGQSITVPSPQSTCQVPSQMQYWPEDSPRDGTQKTDRSARVVGWYRAGVCQNSWQLERPLQTSGCFRCHSVARSYAYPARQIVSSSQRDATS